MFLQNSDQGHENGPEIDSLVHFHALDLPYIELAYLQINHKIFIFMSMLTKMKDFYLTKKIQKHPWIVHQSEHVKMLNNISKII